MKTLREIREIKCPWFTLLALEHDGGVAQAKSKTDSGNMNIVFSWGLGWDHVSVSRANRTPNWYELEQVRAYFFKPNETVMQLHVPSEDHVNIHPNCLHLWRPNDGTIIPTPPRICV